MDFSMLGMIDYGQDIILRGQTIGTAEHPEGQTVCIVVQNIEYSTTIIQLPGISPEEYKQFIYNNIGASSVDIIDLPKQRDAVCAPLQLVQHYKIVSDKQTLKKITYLQHDNEFKSGKPITYPKDKYFRPNDPQQTTTWYASDFILNYSALYSKIQSQNKLEGFDKIIFKHLKYPFRDVVQDYKAVQRRYNINFMDTIRIPLNTPCVRNGPERNYDDNGLQIEYPEYKYAADIVYYVDIKNIQQAPKSLVADTLNFYKGVMFDIENAVYTGDAEPSYTLRDKYIKNQVKGYANNIAMCIFQNDNTNATCDYNEIICISFVEQTFNGKIGKKIALIRGNKDMSVNDAKRLINYDHQDKIQTENDYADEVIIACSEKELLQHTINILTSRKYHCMMHFNGWPYDERVIMTRMALHGLLQQYLDRLQRVTDLNKPYINPSKSIFKLSAQRIYKHICQNADPLYPSVDICLLNLQQDTNAQKHEDGSLQTLLEYYNLGLKGDVSYQELSDWWQQQDFSDDKLFKGYWYCQRDSIQQCKLQSQLKIIGGMIPFTTECNIPLQTAIQRAVGQKVEPAVTAAYTRSKTAFVNIPLPYNEPYVLPDEYVVGQEGSNKQKLDGGEVYAFKLGFDKYISAVDGASMYPAQCEGNNIDNAAMLFVKDLMYVIQNKDKFHIQNIQTYKIKDVYAPYYKNEEVFPYDEIPELMQYYSGSIDVICYDEKSITEGTPEYIIHQKAYRWKIVFTYDEQYALQNNIQNNQHVFEQMFFTRKLQECQYNYVFYLQGKDYENRPYSPRADMLTKFRSKRNNIKQLMETAYKAGDKILGNYYNSYQNAIKTLMNSTYGTTDSTYFCVYENIGAAAITYGSRSMIQYCRDGFTHRIHKLPNGFNMTKLDQYNNFCKAVLVCPEDLTIEANDGIIKIPVVRPKYQDTDSNYIIMPILDRTQVLSRYKKDERYVKTRLFGYFNELFCEIINKSMNRFPLKFAFEGAFYRAWHLSKKCYMGQSVEPECCELAEQDDVEKGIKKGDVIVNKGCNIEEYIKVANFDPESNDIYKYMKSEHFKVTGVKLTRRDAPMLIKQIILQFVDKLLNQDSGKDIESIIIETLINIKDEIDMIPLDRFAVNKKLNSKDLVEGGVVHKYNMTHPNSRLGVGEIMQTIIVKPDYVMDTQKLKGSNFSAADNKRIITDLRPNDKPYVAYYLEQIASTLLAFARTEETTEETSKLAMQLLQDNDLVTYGYREGRMCEEDIPKIVKFYRQSKGASVFYDDDNMKYTKSKVDKYFQSVMQANRFSNNSRMINKLWQDMQ